MTDGEIERIREAIRENLRSALTTEEYKIEVSVGENNRTLDVTITPIVPTFSLEESK